MGGFGFGGFAGGFSGAGGEAGQGAESGLGCRRDQDCASGEECHPTLGCAVVCRSAGDVTIDGEADLVELRERGCAVLEGNLTIHGTTLPNLSALEPNPVRLVTGSLEISENELLESISSLSGLGQIGGSLAVHQNINLLELDGLQSLKLLGRDAGTDALSLTHNASLTNIGALAGLELVLARVVVDSNASLTSLSGLGGVLEAGTIVITGNAELREWDALKQLETCAQPLTVADNARLESLEFPSLLRCDSMIIASNAALERAELPRLAVVQNDLTVVGNSTLQSLDLRRLDSVGALTISGNPRLPQCGVDELSERVGGCASCAGNDEAAACD